MSFSSALYTLKNRLFHPTFAKPQTTRVSISLNLENRGESEHMVTVVLPIPQNAHNQQCTEEVFSEPPRIVHDARFGNRVALISLTLQKESRVNYQASFLVTVAPLHYNKRTRQTSDAYALSPQDNVRYFSENAFLASDDAVTVAAGIAPREHDVFSLVQQFNEYVITNFTYGNPIKGLVSAHDAFAKRVVDCGGFDTALCALCIARGIPARVVSGFWDTGSPTKEMMHAWCEVMMPDGTWIAADPSVEHLVKNGRDRTRSGSLGYIGSDHITFSVGCDIPLTVVEGAPPIHCAILQHPFIAEETSDVMLESTYRAVPV